MSSYNNEEKGFKFSYKSTVTGKTPRAPDKQVHIESVTSQLSLPLRSYLDGFNLNYSLTIPKNSEGLTYHVNKIQILSNMENPPNKILSLYKASENEISTCKNVSAEVPQIDQYIFRDSMYNVTPVFRRSKGDLTKSAIDIIPVRFKNVGALIFVEKPNSIVHEYVVMEFANSMYELARVFTSFRARHLGINSEAEELILYNGNTKEVMVSKLTDKNAKLRRLFLKGNCSQSISPDAILFCPDIKQLRTVSRECGVHFYSSRTYRYNLVASVSFADFFRILPNNKSLKIQGLYGCESEVYVVLKRHGIIKFSSANATGWTYSGLIPNYDGVVLSKYGAFDSSVMAVYGHTNDNESPQPFIRVFDLSRGVVTIPTFDLWLNETAPCEKLVLHSTGVQSIYHLFYLCNKKLYHSNFTLNPLLDLRSCRTGQLHFTIDGYNEYARASVNVSLMIFYSAEVNIWFSIVITAVLMGISVVLFYCWSKERKKMNYKKIVQELKEFHENKLSQASFSSDNLLIQ
eukprot:TRINITY_DN2086_c0_g6_i2.p1 TRINITY_DN2086_c0_g6~~TRINITY_DN2086_c0_g6_i2.p1  ORF type:complete len:517 (+),score=102.81 TRINITY_DN2086_c0_g6_i2:1040-2590(+)